MITIKEVDLLKNKKSLNEFVDLPWKIYKNDKNWVAPLKLSVKDLFNKKHPFYKTASIKAWLAYQGDECVGRIIAVLNDAHNEYHGEKTGFFGFLEAIDDEVVWNALFDAAENFLKTSGMTEVRGPLNPSTNYEGALLVDGKMGPPVMMMSYNPTYYLTQLEKRGYTKSKDLLAYHMDLDKELPAVIHRISDRMEKSKKVTYRKVDLKNWNKDLEKMFDIYNSAWEKNWGFVPMTKDEFFHTAKDLKSIVIDDLILFVEVEGKPAGFFVGLPDLFQVQKEIPSGKLLPFGLFKILNRKKYINRIRVITMGVKPEFRKMGLEALMYKKAQENLHARHPQIKEVEMSWILEDNLEMNKPLLRMGAKPYRRYRIFTKELV